MDIFIIHLLIKYALIISSNINNVNIMILEKINKKIEVLDLKENLGGAGGFNAGIKLAMQYNHDYIWVMDDDTIVQEDSLNKLVNNSILKKEKISFVCSNVLWTDGSICLMNKPKLHKEWSNDIKYNAIKLESTSFVSILINTDCIRNIGYPIKDFFIWGDDYEFTKRATKQFGPGYLITDSLVVHKMNKNTNANILVEDKERINRYYYEFRNKLFISKKNGFKEVVKYNKYVITTLAKVILINNSYKFKKISIILKGVCSGIRFNPTIEKHSIES